MNELIIATIIGWAITKVLDKKAAQATEPSTQLAPGYSQKLGKSIGKWPSVVPDTAGKLNKLFSTDENFIGPGALCQWPQKFQVRNVILQSFVYENQLAAQWSQLSPPDREGRAGDQILDDIQAQKKLRKDLYNNLVTACGSYKAGSGGASASQTISPGASRTIAP
jgi:hypothetical protein